MWARLEKQYSSKYSTIYSKLSYINERNKRLQAYELFYQTKRIGNRISLQPGRRTLVTARWDLGGVFLAQDPWMGAQNVKDGCYHLV